MLQAVRRCRRLASAPGAARLVFIIIFNGALLRPRIQQPYSLTLKFIDDLSVLAAINLKKELVLDTFSNEYTFRAKVNHLTEQLDNLHTFTTWKFMKIKESKSHNMKFNFSKNLNLNPKIQVKGFQEHLKVIEETTLLGYLMI